MAKVEAIYDKDKNISIGRKLKEARLKKNISIDKARKATKIHTNVLESIESDKLESALGATYMKSFLKKYAEYLGVDTEAILKEYSAEKDPNVSHKTKVKERRPIAGDKKALPKRSPLEVNPSYIAIIGLIVWIVVFAFFGKRVITHFSNRPKSVKKTALSISTKDIKDKYDFAKMSSNQNIKREDINFISIPKQRAITATLTTNKALWLKVVQDGTVAFHGTLSKSTKETWRANKEMILSEIGRPEAFTLNVNGKEIDFSGRLPAKKILITQEGIYLDPKQ